MAGTTADYDSSNIYIDPDGLKTKADALLGHAQNVVDSLTNITNTLTNLQLGWAGQTADEARDFGDRWEAVMGELFGSGDHPEDGVMNAIVDGLLVTRGDFSKAEHALEQMFTQFSNDLASGGGRGSGTPSSAPPSINDLNYTATTEIYPG
jgi:hypothetical protein